MTGDWDNTETEGTEHQIKISNFHIHPKFRGNEKITNSLLFSQISTGNESLPTDDLLILELETSVTLTDFVTIANLPKRFNGSLDLSLLALYIIRMTLLYGVWRDVIERICTILSFQKLLVLQW